MSPQLKSLAKRVSQRDRRQRVLSLKLAGGTDREIAEALARDPIAPTQVSHTTVNTDWHEALEELNAAFLGQANQQRMLANARLECLLAAVWPSATQPNPNIAAVDQARRIIKDQRALLGLDHELGDLERPLTTEERVTVDYSDLSDEELDVLIRIGERQRDVINGAGRVT